MPPTTAAARTEIIEAPDYDTAWERARTETPAGEKLICVRTDTYAGRGPMPNDAP